MKKSILLTSYFVLLTSVALAATVDPEIKKLEQQAKENAFRMLVIKKTIHQDPEPGNSNVAYSVRSSYQERLDNSRALASTAISSNSFLRVVNRQLEALNATLYTAATNYYAKSVTFSNACVIAQGLAQSAQAKINAELEELYADKTDLEEKIADSKYVLLRPWLKVKLAAVESRIARLEALTGGGAQ